MFKEVLPANCPPETAHEIEKRAFRILNSNSICEDEFLPYTKLYPDNKRYKNLCKAYGISLYKSKKASLAAYKEAKARNKTLGSYLAELEFITDYGKCTYNDDGEHFTFWFYKKIQIDKIECINIEEILDDEEAEKKN